MKRYCSLLIVVLVVVPLLTIAACKKKPPPEPAPPPPTATPTPRPTPTATPYVAPTPTAEELQAMRDREFRPPNINFDFDSARLNQDAREVLSEVAITGNFMSNQTDNVHLVNCRMVSITGNAFCSATDRNLRIEKCAAITAGANTIDWNPHRRGKQHADGIAIHDSRGVTVSDTIIENCLQADAGAIDVHRSEDVAITDCQILDPKAVGISMQDVTRCRVSNCSIVDRGKVPTMSRSIELTGASRDNMITNNMINRNTLAADPRFVVIRNNVEISNP